MLAPGLAAVLAKALGEFSLVAGCYKYLESEVADDGSRKLQTFHREAEDRFRVTGNYFVASNNRLGHAAILERTARMARFSLEILMTCWRSKSVGMSKWRPIFDVQVLRIPSCDHAYSKSRVRAPERRNMRSGFTALLYERMKM